MRLAKNLVTFVVVGAITPTFAAPYSGSQSDSGVALCDRLAVASRAYPAAAWQNPEVALEPILVFTPPTVSPLAEKLTALPAVKDALDGVNFPVTVEQMSNANIYMISTVMGTAHCQSSAFIDASPGRAPRSVDPPAHQNADCWSQHGDLGVVFGQAALIDHGTLTDHTFDEAIEITPWTGQGWGKSCHLDLHFAVKYSLIEQFCGDADVCRMGGKIAVAVAAAYNEKRTTADDMPVFRFGYTPKEAVVAVDRVRDALPDGPPDFPTFGSLPWSPPYSNEGTILFPLTLNGKSYVAAIGHSGVGWRESNETLLSIFTESGGALKPLAGFVLDASVEGLAETVVTVKSGGHP